MSVVILGGNECMVRTYHEICEEFGCKAKILAKEKGAIKKKIGCPDLLILFTDTVSHKMVISALQEAKRNKIPVARIRTGSANALKSTLSAHCAAM